MERPAVLVIGGGRRMGRAICLEFARRGYDVAVNARTSRSEVSETVALVGAEGVGAVAAMGDATVPEAAEGAVGAAIGAFGRLDAMIYCAGQRNHDRITDIEPAAWKAAISSVLDGILFTTKYAAPHLEQQRGAIVLISGASAFVGNPAPAVPTAKLGMVGFARSAAIDLGPRGVRVNVLSPGRIEAPGDAPDYLERLRKGRPDDGIPLRRAGTTGEIARVAAALAGPDFSYVTGQVIHVNGGFYLG